MKDIFAILKQLGLSDSEVQVYLAALGTGPVTAQDLAKKTGLSRQAVYSAIDGLTSRALVSSLMRGKKRFFAAEPPARLLAYAKRRDAEMHERVQDLDRLLPDLDLQAGGDKPVVRVFEGKQGLLGIIEDIRGTKQELSAEITDLDAMYKVLSLDDLKRLRTELQRQGIWVQGIYSGTPSVSGVKAERLMLPPERAGFKSNVGIYGNKIVLATFEGKMYSVIIESPQLAKTMRILFDLALKGAGMAGRKPAK